jgi:small-conductance mechanosensitive channel
MVNTRGPNRRNALSGYKTVLIEFLATVITLVIVGSFLTAEHATLGITLFYAKLARFIVLVVGVFAILGLIQYPLKSRLQARHGVHFASAFTFFATLVLIVAAFLALLGILSIPPSTLLVAVGGLGVVVGFAISTVTSNVIAGAFMLTSFPIKVGQRIVITINNQPGTITGVSTLFTTVRTDAGANLVIPNSAIIQGFAFLLEVDSKNASESGGADDTLSSELLPKPGERVISTSFPYPATVTEVSSLVTKLTTDAGQVLTIPNQSLLNGNYVLARIEGKTTGLPVSVGDEVRLSTGDFRGTVSEIGADYIRVSGKGEEVVLPISSVLGGGVSIFRRLTGDDRSLQN